MKEWFEGGANRITLARIPAMVLALLFLIVPERIGPGAFWHGATALVLGMILDGLDGYWARHIGGGATRRGQFLDPFVDKWGFVYPILVGLLVSRPEPLPLAQVWYAGLGLMFLLDVTSTIKHYAKYCADERKGITDLTAGANNFGKAKFWFQNAVMCILYGQRAPELTPGQAWWEHVTNFVTSAGHWLQPAALICLGIACVLAIVSLLVRFFKKSEAAVPATAQAVTSA